MIMCVAYCAFFATKFTPDQPVVPLTVGSAKAASKKAPLKPFQEYAGIVIFFADAAALMFSDTLHLAIWQVTFIGALLMILCGVLKPKKATAAIPYMMEQGGL